MDQGCDPTYLTGKETMGFEIERKFLVKVGSIPSLPPGTTYEQFYIAADPWVRVRILSGKRAGVEPTAKLTIKGKGTLSRLEFEYDIPVADARALEALNTRGKR